MSEKVIQMLRMQPGYVGTGDAAIARIRELEDMLREVRDKGLIYWEPNTQRGHLAKEAMLSRIAGALHPET